ncbi:MAG TPA: APC family permease [Ktedonobacteraceae bacterium]|nr:APC family permease [Ktedonobacteraceae bacterium]
MQERKRKVSPFKGTPEQQVSQSGQYKQELARNIGVISAVGITVSGIAPLPSIFMIAPIIFDAQGSGVFLSSLIAAIISLGMALCYAELGSAFPVTGGEYAVVARVLGRPLGFVTFTAFLVMSLSGVSAFGLGTAFYLEDFLPGINGHLLGAVIVLATAAIALLPIKSNALIMGIFLALQIAVILVIALLGFTHLNQPLSILIHPQDFSHGHGEPVSPGVIILGVTLAIMIFGGYNAPMYFSEEVVNPRRNVPSAILWSLALTVAISILPLIAILLGTPSLRALTTADNPMSYVLHALGGQTIASLLILSVVLATFNCSIAGILGMSRIFYSSGRDKAWPGPISAWMAYYHPRLKTPIVATVFIGIIGTLLAAFTDVDELFTFTAFLMVVLFALVALAALVSRFTQRNLERPYKMPLWPIPPLVGLLGCITVATQQSLFDIIIVAVILLLGGLYYALYLRPRAATHWVMLKPIASEQDEHAIAGR